MSTPYQTQKAEWDAKADEFYQYFLQRLREKGTKVDAIEVYNPTDYKEFEQRVKSMPVRYQWQGVMKTVLVPVEILSRDAYAAKEEADKATEEAKAATQEANTARDNANRAASEADAARDNLELIKSETLAAKDAAKDAANFANLAASRTMATNEAMQQAEALREKAFEDAVSKFNVDISDLEGFTAIAKKAWEDFEAEYDAKQSEIEQAESKRVEAETAREEAEQRRKDYIESIETRLSSFLTADALEGYATEEWVSRQGYLTEAWLNGKGFLTEEALSGYAKTADVTKTLSIQRNGVQIGSYNGTDARTIDIFVPTNTNELDNGAGFITSSALNGGYVTTNTAQTITGLKAISGVSLKILGNPSTPTRNAEGVLAFQETDYDDQFGIWCAFSGIGSDQNLYIGGSGSGAELETSAVGTTMTPYLTINHTTGNLSVLGIVNASYFTAKSTTLCSNLNADLLDGFHETSFFRHRGIVANEYYDGTKYSTLLNGVYQKDWGGYSSLLIHFQNTGSTSGLDIYTNYNQTDLIYFRKTIDSNRFASSDWSYFITNLNISSQSVASATRLQTPRSIWGRSFDGTGDISGNMTGVGDILPLATFRYNIGANTNEFNDGYIRRLYARHLDGTTSGGMDGNLYINYGLDNDSSAMTFILGSNVGIGTTSPSYKLHVAGSFCATGDFQIGDKNGTNYLYGNDIYLQVDSTIVLQAPDWIELNGTTKTRGSIYPATANTNTIGNINSRYSTIYGVSGNFTSTVTQNTSDLRLKKDFTKTDCLSRLLSIGEVFSFRYNELALAERPWLDDTTRHTGIAWQTAEKCAIPDFTGIDEKGFGWVNFLSSDYQAVLLGAVRELARLREADTDRTSLLESRISALETENESLRKRIQRLEPTIEININ